MSNKRDKILILGGTHEALKLATQLHETGHHVTTSLAGRTDNPTLPDGEIRVGGFGGSDGMADWIKQHHINRVIDATHPFATQISANAKRACDQTKTPLEVINRPPWIRSNEDLWTEVATLAKAVESIPSSARVFLALGSQFIEPFAIRDDVHFTIRMINNPKSPLPFSNANLIIGKPSPNWQDESTLLKQENITHIVCRNSGGLGAYAKIKAARMNKIPVIMVQPETKS